MIKIPTEIIIAGYKWKIKKSKKIRGGNFSQNSRIIEIEESCDKSYTFEVLLHEIIEAILTSRNLRYDTKGNNDNSDLIFVLNHNQFEEMIKDIKLALEGLLNEN